MSMPVRDSLLCSVVKENGSRKTNLQAMRVFQVLESLFQGLDLAFQLLFVI